MYSTSGGGGQSQALAQEEDLVYGQDESYDDYEQYGDGSGGYDGSLLDPNLSGAGADGNKGRTSLLSVILPSLVGQGERKRTDALQ
jgi:hypothetical protein